MKLEFFLRFAYFMVVISLILMIWASFTGARRIVNDEKHPPCYFNPLCSCSRAVPDLGVVRCQDILLPRIPETINTSRVYMLHLENNGLSVLEPYFLRSTGIYGLSITYNLLTLVHDEAFLGLERSLWELDLSYNRLIQIPTRAMRYLQKLKYLDLTGNDISAVHIENWKGLESLERLILAENSITHLASDAFGGLPLLDTINLKGNNLRDIDPSIFREGMNRLAHIILADNQLTSIPYLAVAPLKMLRTLDLSFNRIVKMKSENSNLNVQLDLKLTLDILRLDYNQLSVLETGDFQYFLSLNQTYLDGNQLQNIKENAFRQSRIRELYIRDCSLNEISPSAFGGLENYLQVLDLSGNHIKNLEQEIFHRFDILRVLSLEDNLLNIFNPMEAFNSFQYSLTTLDLSGRTNAAVNTQLLKHMKNLRVLKLGNIQERSLREENFREYGIDLEILSITSGNVESIHKRAFQHIHSLKKLDLSDNSINQIDNDAFLDLGHSLISLKCSHALSISMNKFPFESMRPLVNLEELDFSNNKLRNLPETSFHFLKDLQIVELQDNEIETIKKGTFQGDIHLHIKSIYLSFNSLKAVQQHSFADLNMLEQIHLDDNRIINIDRRAFMNLENLKRLNLKGNKIETVSYEAFQNLPELEDLDMSYNRLSDFQFSMFDQVGTLSAFRVNMSHNNIKELQSNVYGDGSFGGYQSNIKCLDLSFNNISKISYQFFKPIELSLTHLFINHNSLMNATKDIFGNMPHLQWIDLSYNKLFEIEYDVFRNTKNLQVVNLSHNHLPEIPKDLFRYLINVRVVDFSNNRIRFLPDNLFSEEGLEVLKMSHNQLSRVPLSSMTTSAASSLCYLDLSFNGISAISHGEIFSKFKVLTRLDLTYNKLVQVDAGVLGFLPQLTSLDLSHNIELVLEKNGKSFLALDDSLLYLGLSNISLTYVPELPLPNLISLSLSNNFLPTIPPEMASNLTSLRILNLANNDLTSVPIVTHSLDFLKSLSLSGNPISILSNTSLLGVADHLEELDITDLNLNVFEGGALCKLHFMQTLKMTAYEHVKDFNIPRVLESNYGLRKLLIDVNHDTNLRNQMQGKLPPKIRSITFIGKRLKSIDHSVLQCVLSPTLHLSFYNTGIVRVPSSLFEDLKYVRNISLNIENNNQMQFFENPSTGNKVGVSRRTFLTDLSISGSQWSCDCDLGWVEVWHRKKRQYICGDSPSNPASDKEHEYNCRHADDDLRNTLCSNKMNQSLIEIFKTEIECGWSSSVRLTANFFIFLIVLIYL